jgi:hypothetical protein
MNQVSAPPATDRAFRFWVRYLEGISLFFAALGVLWAVAGSFDPLGVYDHYFARTFWGSDALPPDARTAFRFILGPFGATSAGYFILQYCIARYAFARREKWAYGAILTAFFAWFVIDTGMCLWYGGYFNILMANVPSLLAMLPIVFTRKYFGDDAPQRH